jgi:hypothetical protein
MNLKPQGLRQGNSELRQNERVGDGCGSEMLNAILIIDYQNHLDLNLFKA